MDISSFMNWFIELFMNLFSSFYSTLRSIQFLGTNLFDFMLSVFIMGAVFPLLVSVARNSAGSLNRLSSRTVNNHYSKKGGSDNDD